MILLANFIKHFNHLIAFTSVHRPYCFTLPSSVSVSEFVVKNIRRHVLFFWMFLYRNSSLTKATDSCSFLLKKYFIVVNLSHITLSLNHSMMLLEKKLANQKHAIAFDEIFIATPHQVTKREKMLFLSLLSAFLSFFSFPLFSLLRPLLQISKG